MLVSRIKLRNWRNFTDADLPLREIVCLIGPNASVRVHQDEMGAGEGSIEFTKPSSSNSAMLCM